MSYPEDVDWGDGGLDGPRSTDDDDNDDSLTNLRTMVTKTIHKSFEKPYQLPSGRTTPYHFNITKACGNPYFLVEAGKHIANIARMAKAKSVGGLEFGSFPLAVAASMSSMSFTQYLDSFWVRKAIKGRAHMVIEGYPHSPCMLVDDVVTTGEYVVSGIKALSHHKKDCRGVICVLFRGSAQDLDYIRSYAPVYHLFTDDDFFPPG